MNRDVVSMWGDALGARDADTPVQGAYLSALTESLRCRRARDAVFVLLVTGDAYDAYTVATAARGGGTIAQRAVATVMSGQAWCAPDVLQAWRRLLRDVAEHATATNPVDAAPPLTLDAVAAWIEGDHAGTTRAANAAMTADPSYRLAHLLAAACAVGIPAATAARAPRVGAID